MTVLGNYHQIQSKPGWLVGFFALALGGIFVLDFFARAGVATGVLYGVLILAGWRLPGRHAFLWLILVCLALAAARDLLTPAGSNPWLVGTNLVLEFVAIGTAAWGSVLVKAGMERTRTAEGKFQNLVEGSIEAIFIHRDFRLLFANKAYASLLGYDSVAELMRLNLLDDVVTPEFREQILISYTARMKGESAPSRVAHDHRKKDGTIMRLETQLTIIDWDGIPAVMATGTDFTPQMEAERKLREQQRLLQTVFDALPHWLYVKDHQARFQMVNKSIADAMGLAPEDFIGKKITDLPAYTEVLRQHYLESDQRVLEFGERLEHRTIPFVTADRREIFLEAIKVPLHDEDGNTVGLVGVNFDVSARIHTEMELRKTTNLLQTVFDTIPHRMWIKDAQGRYLAVNETFAREIGGYDTRGWCGKTAADVPFINQERIAGILEEDRQVRESGIPMEFPAAVAEISDGSVQVIRSLKVPIWDEKGGYAGIVGMAEDIAEKQQAFQKLEENQKLLQTVFDTIPHRLWLKDAEGRYLAVNEAFAREYGRLNAQEWRGKTLEEIPGLTEETHRTLAEEDRQVREKGETMEFINSTMEKKNGTVQMLRTFKTPIYDLNGDFSGMVGIAEDTTELWSANRDLRVKDAALASSINGIALADGDGRIFYANQVFCDMVAGGDENKVVGHLACEFWADQDLAALVFETTLSQGSWVGEVEGIRSDGTRFEGQVSASLVRDAEGKTIAMMASVLDISEKKAAERKLRASQELLKTVFDSFPHQIYVKDRSGAFLMVNHTMAAAAGWSPSQMVGKLPHDLAHLAEITRKAIAAEDKHVFNTGKPLFLENQEIAFSDGSRRIYRRIKVPLKDETGQVIAMFGTNEDITQRLEAEKALVRFKNTLDMTLDAIFMIEPKTMRFSYANQGAMGHLGYNEVELLRMTPLDIDPEFPVSRYREMVKPLTRGKATSLTFTTVHRHKDGRRIPVEISLQYVSPAGEEPRFVAIVRDITRRKKTEDELLESKKLLETVVDHLPQTLSIRDREGRFMMVNRTYSDLVGIPPEKFVGKKLEEIGFFSDEIIARAVAETRKVFETGQKMENIESTVTLKDGRKFYRQLVRTPLLDANGELTGVITISTDITDRVLAEAERLRLSIAVNQAAEGVVITDLDGKIQYANPAFEQITGYKKEEINGKNSRILNSGRHPSEYYKVLWDTILSGEVWRGNFINKRKDGTLYDDESIISPVRNRNGELVNFIAIKRDITEHKRTQEQLELQERQLIQADKMASLGVLVAGVAHEINNPNTSIMFNAPLVASIWEEVKPLLEKVNRREPGLKLGNMPYETVCEEVSAMLADISKGSERVKRIVANLKNFSRKNERQSFETVELNRVVESAVNLLRGQIAQMTHKFSVVYSSENPSVLGNFQEIEQVVINLITNACQALRHPGKGVCITTARDSEEKRVLIQVRDKGEGISEANLKKIMDPFFTTKRESGGTGLGLSVSFGIVRDHGGNLDFQSVEGEGTVATLSFQVG